MGYNTTIQQSQLALRRMQAQIAGIKAQRALARLSASLHRSSPGAGMTDPRIAGPRICETDMPTTRAADPVIEAARALLLSDDVLKHWRTQPRVPAGSPQGGQWTTDGGGGGAQVHQVGRRGQNEPPNRPPNQRQRYEPFPQSGFIMYRGVRIDVNIREFVAYQSSFHRAEGLTWLVRQHDSAWRPTSSMSQGLQGAISSQNYTATQAMQRLQDLNPAFLRVRDINHILTPGGNPVGHVHRRSTSDIRTVSWQEFQQIHAQLTFGARQIEALPQRGVVFQRSDGVIINFRFSVKNGPTIDIQNPNVSNPLVTKIHLSPQQIKKVISMLDINNIEDDEFILHRHIRFHEVRPVSFDKMDAVWDFYKITFHDYCLSKLDDHDDYEDAEDLSKIQVRLEGSFEFEGEDLDQAMLFFITHLVAHGYVPMRDGGEVHYFVPEYRYGTKPQEIIDNIMAEWRRRGRQQFDFWELYLGFEPYCGGFYPDSPELSGVNED